LAERLLRRHLLVQRQRALLLLLRMLVMLLLQKGWRVLQQHLLGRLLPVAEVALLLLQATCLQKAMGVEGASASPRRPAR
jgi:hypothetical protein